MSVMACVHAAGVMARLLPDDLGSAPSRYDLDTAEGACISARSAADTYCGHVARRWARREWRGSANCAGRGQEVPESQKCRSQKL